MKNIFQIHSVAGIIAGVFLLLLSLSGSVLVFSDEIDEAMNSELFHLPVTGAEPQPLEKLYSNAKAYLGHHPFMYFLRLPQKPGEPVILRAEYGPEHKVYILMNPYTGEVVGTRSNKGYFTGWLLYLHFTLLAGKSGAMVQLFIGGIFLISLVTGIIIYRKSFGKVLAFKSKLEWSNPRRKWRNLHRIVGVWSVVFNLLIVVTGILMQVKVVNARKDMSVIQGYGAHRLAFDDYYKIAKEAMPDLNILGIRLPKAEGGPVVVMGNQGGTKFFGEYNSGVQVDAASGKVVKVLDFNNASFSQKFAAAVKPLHFGNYGGIFLKIVYSLFGLMPGILSLSGTVILLRRTLLKPKGKEVKKQLAGIA